MRRIIETASRLSSSSAARRVAMLVAITVAMAACRDPDTADSEGTLRGEIDLTIGELDGADEYIFGRIGGIAVDPDGRIFVADNDANTIRVFAPDGKFRYAFGRRGQGPGEMVGPCCIALRGDTLWVRDGANNRYDLFVAADTAAVYHTSVRMAHRDRNRWTPLTFDSAGNAIDIGTLYSGSASPDEKPVLTRFHLDRTGGIVAQQAVPAPPEDSTPVHRVTSKVEGGMMTRYVYPPYPPLALHAHSPRGEHARAVSSRYSIGWFAANGALLRTIDGKVDPPELSPSEIARAESALTRDIRWLEPGASNSPFTVPRRKQPLRGLFFDLDGRLWVELSVPQGAPRKADVYGPDGRLQHTIEWPSNVTLGTFGAVTGMTAYGVLVDSLDVERVARLRLR